MGISKQLKDFYKIFAQHGSGDALVQLEPKDVILLIHIKYLQICGATNTSNVIYLYLKNLCDLYRRRTKYYNILQKQPFPSVDQIGPRCLLEYGNSDNNLLFNWMS